MTAAGAPMTHHTVSRIERGEQRIYYDEAVLFAGVLEEAFVRLASPREGEEIAVRVDGHRPPLQPVEFRNWFVYGHWWTPAAVAAQEGMRFAHDAYAVVRPGGDEHQKAAARTRIEKLLGR